MNIIRQPDKIFVQNENDWVELFHTNGDSWENKDIKIEMQHHNAEIQVMVYSAAVPLKRIKIRWKDKIDSIKLILNDQWERSVADLEWECMVPEKILPWYFAAYDGKLTHGYGVKTGCRSMCFWQIDNSGISLWLDIRCGGIGVDLSKRNLLAAVIVSRKGKEGESPFQAVSEFCGMMCDKPVFPDHPIYGSNNWYYAYGKISENTVLDDAKLISGLSVNNQNRPYMVIDDGWQECRAKSEFFNGGPWNRGNYLFPDMRKLAGKMVDEGVKPGLWFRPLLTIQKVPEEFILQTKPQNGCGQVLDPSVPGALEMIENDVKRIVDWGYQLIKHDFSSYDIFGKSGKDMKQNIADDGWSFSDKQKTSAEIILDLYLAIKKASNNVITIGCNTFNHLSAGIFHIQRVGDDTSGRVWEITRRDAINALAFRLPQHGKFFTVDADCAGITKKVPWEMNRQFMEITALSGTALFASISRDAVGKDQEIELKRIFEIASKTGNRAEPLDWMQTTCPAKWSANGKTVNYDWFGDKGVNEGARIYYTWFG